MDLKLIGVLFLVCLPHQISPKLHFHVFSFIEKSLLQCQLHSGPNVKETKNESISDVNRSRRDTAIPDSLSLVPTFKYYFYCVLRHWDLCFTINTLSKLQPQYNASLSLEPCYYGNLHLSSHDYMLHIEVQQIFQINLTFTHFHLERNHPHCEIHSVKVSYCNLFSISI